MDLHKLLSYFHLLKIIKETFRNTKNNKISVCNHRNGFLEGYSTNTEGLQRAREGLIIRSYILNSHTEVWEHGHHS